jgi:hypothetical protein
VQWRDFIIQEHNVRDGWTGMFGSKTILVVSLVPVDRPIFMINGAQVGAGVVEGTYCCIMTEEGLINSSWLARA